MELLHLTKSTPERWSAWALDHIDEILVDHAHCEKKAASTAVGLIFRYPHHEALVMPLSRLAREELEHFEQVVEHVRGRGVRFRRQRPSPYAALLREIVRESEPEQAVDTLLCCAMIEARSCERMQLLVPALREAGEHALAELYESLLASEARHHASFVDLARSIGALSDEALRVRLDEIAAHEARAIVGSADVVRLHNWV